MRCTVGSKAFVLAVLVVIAAASACGSTNEPRTGIAGSVRDWGTFGGSVPAAEVQVECLDASTGQQAAATKTGRRGSFFLSVPAGRYQVAYASGSRPMWVKVEVVDGKVTTLEPFVGGRFGPHVSPPQQRLKAILQPEALALGIRRKTAVLAVSGTTVGAATKLFGTSSTLPASTHVWVCVLTGDVEGWSSTTAARDLARGGFVAYELRPSTLERLATGSASRKWRLLDWAGPDDWGGTLGFALF
jgi:hypothetical protein